MEIVNIDEYLSEHWVKRKFTGGALGDFGEIVNNFYKNSN